MALVRWEPFNEFDRFFEELPVLRAGGNSMTDMAVDLYEEGGDIVAEMSVPGIEAENVEVTVEGNYLRIVGKREEEKERKGKQYYSKEIRRGSFERAVRLPEPVNESAVKAEYDNGLLTVRLPKAAPKKKNTIQVVKKKK